MNVCQDIILAIEQVKTVKRVGPLESEQIVFFALYTRVVLIMRYGSLKQEKKNFNDTELALHRWSFQI